MAGYLAENPPCVVLVEIWKAAPLRHDGCRDKARPIKSSSAWFVGGSGEDY